MESYPASQRLAWSLAEISELTNLSLPFLRAEVRGGRLEVRKFGRRVLVRDQDLEKYLAQGSPGNKGSQSESAQE